MTAICTSCESIFYHVDRDEDGAPYIETTRCAHPGCEVYLCKAGCEHLSFACVAVACASARRMGSTSRVSASASGARQRGWSWSQNAIAGRPTWTCLTRLAARATTRCRHGTCACGLSQQYSSTSKTKGRYQLEPKPRTANRIVSQRRDVALDQDSGMGLEGRGACGDGMRDRPIDTVR